MPSNVKPRYVRVAQALALITGLSGASACGESDTPTMGMDAAGVDSAMSDTGVGTDTGGTDTTTTDAGMTDTTGTDTVVADTGSMDASVDTPPNDVAVDTATDTAVDTGRADVGTDAVADIGIPEDAGVKCFIECTCFGEDPALPDCFDVEGGAMCCVAIGPLFPPNLPA